MSEERVTIQPGMEVFGSDDQKVGEVGDTGPDYIVVSKGFFFPKDHYIPLDAVDGVDEDGKLYLTVTKDEALNQGWDEAQPATGGYVDTGAATESGASYDTSSAVGTSAADLSGAATTKGTGSGDTEVIGAGYVAADDVAASGQDAVRVPIHEEQLSAVKRRVNRGAVRIEKELVTEDRTITVPVTEERVRVTRVDADPNATVGDTAFEGGVIEVPISGEEVDLQKTARVAGEVVVEKEQVQHTEEVAGTVRREEVRVDDETVAVDGANGTPKREGLIDRAKDAVENRSH